MAAITLKSLHSYLTVLENASEEEQLRQRLDKFNARFGGKPCGKRIFEADEQDKAKVDAYLAATDLLEAMVLTPWCISLNNAVSIAAYNSIRSVTVIASHFERFSRGEITKERANQEIADHLLAFARQFSADTKPSSHPEQMISETDEKEIIQTAEQETKASKGITLI